MAKKRKGTRQIIERYAAYDERAREQVENAVNYLTDQYGEVSPEWLGSLDMMAINFNLLYTSLDDVARDGITVTTRNGDTARHPALKVIVDSQVALSRLCKELGVTPYSRARISKNETESETVAQSRLLESILN